MPNGSLSLAARLYLLAWDPERMTLTGAWKVAHLLRAGALAELAQRGLLADDDGVAVPVGDSRTGDPALDGLLELIEESRPRKWKSWVTFHPTYTLEAVRTQLAGAGYLRTRRRRVLGVFPSAEYELDRPDLVKSLRDEARSVLLGPQPAAEVSDRDAALVALAAAAELRTLATGKERRLYRNRIEALTDRGGASIPVLRKVIEEVRTAVIVAATSESAARTTGEN
ncbi:GPP34 family phosphoprotein [Streptomyces sp. NPDC001820]|uniref:GOLPH3/VPS74 family protein n=1 Tax=Streptomyces sp. NPDC001820 TaxID=3364613 RepID=UPI0036CCBEFB